MLEALLLRFQPSLLNILPLYVVLLVFFAATIWMLRWPRLLVRVLPRDLSAGARHRPQSEPGTKEAGFSTRSPGSSCSSSACCWPARRCDCPSRPGCSIRRRRGGRSGRGRDGGDRTLSASARSCVPLGVPVAGGGRQDQPVPAPADLDPGADLAVRPADPLRFRLAAVALGRAAGAARTKFTAGVLLRHRHSGSPPGLGSSTTTAPSCRWRSTWSARSRCWRWVPWRLGIGPKAKAGRRGPYRLPPPHYCR